MLRATFNLLRNTCRRAVALSFDNTPKNALTMGNQASTASVISVRAAGKNKSQVYVFLSIDCGWTVV
jgi:hypothetical protein